MKHSNLILLLCLALLGCNKKKQAEPVVNTTSGTNTITNISGTFNSYYYLQIDALGNVSMDSLNTAEVYPSPTNGQSPNTVYGGTVIINGNDIPFNSTYLGYFQQTANINMQQLNWAVTGSANVPAFTYSYIPIYPNYNYTNLPDTCIKTNGITITINSIQNADPNLFVYTAVLMQNQGSIQSSKTINYSATPTNTVYFSPNDLASFNTNQDLDIIITLYNYKYVTINSLNYSFISSRYYNKASYLK